MSRNTLYLRKRRRRDDLDRPATMPPIDTDRSSDGDTLRESDPLAWYQRELEHYQLVVELQRAEIRRLTGGAT